MDDQSNVRHLASSVDFEAAMMPRPPEFMPLAVSNTTAYFTTVLRKPQTSTAVYTAIVAAPLTGGEAKILIHDAHLAAVGNRGIYFVRDAGTSRTTKRGVAEIWFASPDAGPRLVHTQTLRNLNEQIRGMCLAGDKLIWVTGDATEGAHGRITILGPNGSTKHIGLLQAAWEPGLTCSDHLIGWATGSASPGEDTTQYVYSLATGTKWKAGDEGANSWVRINGNTVAFISMTENSYRIVRWLH